MRMVDMIATHGVRLAPGQVDSRAAAEGLPILAEGIAESTVVDATNVYEYRRQGGKENDLYDLPCMAPPHELMFVEYLQRNGKRVGLLGHAKEGPYSLAGTVPENIIGANGFQRRFDRTGSKTYRVWTSENLPDQKAWDEVRWTWLIHMFQEHGGRVYGPLSMMNVALDHNGRLLDVCWGLHVDVTGHPDQEKVVNELTLYPFDVFGTTITFMQCANIRTVYVTPPPNLSRKHRRKGHIKGELAGYHVLKLAAQGPETRIRGKGNGAGDELVAFHPVRGEFHHYGDCCPGAHPPKGLLFGRHTGRYWVPAHVRGNPERGQIRQDFEIRPVEQ